ncbi:hypothetical protein LLEC1_00034 [Akanthomyces lecanii]|uniref:Homeobox domain-containing protein n=1 Tax=Cordyceps confragosa TaxID=2714763 RepID=A0A179I887_CORDF|nr:hypothetical protein LLEC1_00034 [Akanthomyces lecanii]
MAMIAVATPPPSSAFQSGRWAGRPSSYAMPRADPNPVALPSIRQAIPEIHLATNTDRQHRPAHPSNHPPGWTDPAPSGHSQYIHSPTSKRRRISNDLETESLRSHQVPRLYPSPERPVSSNISPSFQRPPTADDSWRSQAPAHYKSSMSASPEFAYHEHRPSLHSLPLPPGMERGRDGHYADDYVARQRMGEYQRGHSRRSPVFGSRPYDNGNRFRHPMSAGPVRAEERSPFAPSRYVMPQHDVGRYNEGMVGIGGETKQRKRRGNLPKETTDKLRSWFVAHLQHPYPTEDEKQELMRVTGLQMNQISNWFINARRRQLPTMINNARAESDAMHNRCGVDRASIGSADVDMTGLDRESTYDASPRMHGVGGLERD